MRHVQFTSRYGFWFFLTVGVIVITGVATRGIVGSTAVAIAKAAAVLSIVVVGSWTLPPRVIVACGFHIIAVTVIVAMPMVVC